MKVFAKVEKPRGAVYREEGFSCGMCKRQYPDRIKARSCANRCLVDASAKRPILTVFDGKAMAFRCSLCCREYANQQEASSCVKECTSDFQSRAAKMDGVTVEKIFVFEKNFQPVAKTIVPDDKKFVRNQARYQCAKCSKNYFTKVEVVSCFDRHK